MSSQVSVSEATKTLVSSGTITTQAAVQLSQRNRTISVADIRAGFEDPTLGCFIVDASPSMEPYIDDVIAGQRQMIDILRASAKCRMGALYVGQWLFSNETTLLNPFSVLAQTGNDAVALLDKTRYRPQDGDGTALYATVFHVLQDMAANIAFALEQNIRTTFTLGLITDGEDNQGGAKPADIKTIVSELRANEYLTKSVVIGIENPKLSRKTIVDIQNSLGFDDAIFVGQSGREIRRAFALASRASIG
ncbi:hypothetical protein TSA1_29685 [Bradyrhizobium nitroreducens]|uniref:VWFA domain-containing protein n=1 Tax=Bradyrhizobium nitroreducens TaxID=709803 RepID=A0A2M6UIV1_9BRAD|nr:vWA domain-containing protein [Bradyrhizobium nitroreducens]PIT04465.1 hypothetical protein TSA1_29685 [Bradyrhizobium nitroreducens]